MSDLKRKMKRVFGFWTRLLAGVAVVLFLSVVVVSIPKWQVQRDLRADRISWSDVPQQENEYRKTLIQIAGGVVVAIGLYLTWRRINATEEAQVTDRFSEAIEQIGDPSLEVRLGGIYALERIAEDSPRDHWTVMETLCAFVRENASSLGEMKDGEGEAGAGKSKETAGLDTDIQAACTVIGRRRKDQDPEKALDLCGALLSGADLQDANLSEADLQDANLSEAKLTGANLSGAHLANADLSKATLRHADLSGAFFHLTNLSKANLRSADLSEATLWDTNLSDANLKNVDLSEAFFMGPFLPGAILADANLSGTSIMSPFLCEAQTLDGAQLDPELEGEVRKQCPGLLEESW